MPVAPGFRGTLHHPEHRRQHRDPREPIERPTDLVDQLDLPLALLHAARPWIRLGVARVRDRQLDDPGEVRVQALCQLVEFDCEQQRFDRAAGQHPRQFRHDPLHLDIALLEVACTIEFLEEELARFAVAVRGQQVGVGPCQALRLEALDGEPARAHRRVVVQSRAQIDDAAQCVGELLLCRRTRGSEHELTAVGKGCERSATYAARTARAGSRAEWPTATCACTRALDRRKWPRTHRARRSLRCSSPA